MTFTRGAQQSSCPCTVLFLKIVYNFSSLISLSLQEIRATAKTLVARTTCPTINSIYSENNTLSSLKRSRARI